VAPFFLHPKRAGDRRIVIDGQQRSGRVSLGGMGKSRPRPRLQPGRGGGVAAYTRRPCLGLFSQMGRELRCCWSARRTCSSGPRATWCWAAKSTTHLAGPHA
jgi:hypothetical protein